MGVFRKRDAAVLLLVALGLYIAIFDSPTVTYRIDPAWFIDQQPQKKDTLDPSGKVTMRDLYGGRGHFDYKQIPPLITDLDGDENNEVVMISTDLQLQIFDANVPGGDSNEVYHPVEINAVDLYPERRSAQRGREPVALKTGYVQHYMRDKARSQVIVVVHDDWTISCYDYKLNMLWEKAAGFHKMHLDKMSRFFRIDDASVYIAPLHLKKDDSSSDTSESPNDIRSATESGTIIVGASMKVREQFISAFSGSSRDEEEDRMHPSVKQFQGMKQDKPRPFFAEYESQLEHFTIYALDSLHGEVIWAHDGLEVRSEQYSRSLPQHAYSLDLKDLMTKTHHAPGINDWTVFRQSLLDELPHTWFGNHHTNMRIAHFMRRHIGAHAGHQSIRSPHSKRAEKMKILKSVLHPDAHKGKGRNGKRATLLHKLPLLLQGEVKETSLAESATLPHNAAEHTENPNVIVAHTRRGVEVIALRTGTPITSLALSSHKVYADVNGDDIVDTITVLDDAGSVRKHESEFKHHQYEYSSESLKQCMIVAMSGLPAQSQLFNGSVCQSRPSLRDRLGYATVPRRATAATIDEDSTRTKVRPVLKEEDDHPMIVHTAPLILHKLDPDTLEESEERDIITAIHSGVVTSYSGSGEFNWQVKGCPTWSIDEEAAVSKQFPTLGPSGPPAEGEDAASDEAAKSPPAVAEVSSQTVAAVVGFDADAGRAEDLGSHNSIYSNILVVGETTMALLSREGEVLATAELPRPPKAAPILGDFDNDGVSDVLIVTDGAVLGFHVHVEQASRSLLIALTVLIIITVVVFVSNIQSVPMESLIYSGEVNSAGAATTASSAATAAQFSSSSASSSAGAAIKRAAHLLRKPRGKGGSIFQIIRSTDEQHID